jgi:hypothetical protein
MKQVGLDGGGEPKSNSEDKNIDWQSKGWRNRYFPSRNQEGGAAGTA